MKVLDTTTSAGVITYILEDVDLKASAKISKVLGEFKRGQLHSGSKRGPKVTSHKQAVAIALNSTRKGRSR